MLRVSTALFDDRGKRYGILLINIDFNVFARSVHQRLDYHNGAQNFFITNAKSEYLLHHDPNKTMAFEYQRHDSLNKDFQINRRFLQNSSNHSDSKIDQYLFGDQGLLLILGNVHFDRAHPERFLHVGGTFSLHHLRQQSLGLRDRMLWWTLVLALFLGMTTYYVARYFTRPIRHIIQAAELKHLAEKLEAQNTKLEQAAVAKSQFLATMSHEFALRSTVFWALPNWCWLIKCIRSSAAAWKSSSHPVRHC